MTDVQAIAQKVKAICKKDWSSSPTVTQDEALEKYITGAIEEAAAELRADISSLSKLLGEAQGAQAIAEAERDAALAQDKELMSTLDLIERICGDDFCEDLDMHTIHHSLQGHLKIAHEKLTTIYRYSHSISQNHVCYSVHEDWREEARTAIASLGAPSAAVRDAPPEKLCADCGKPKSDSDYHLEAPGTNWGAALHHFRADAFENAGVREPKDCGEEKK